MSKVRASHILIKHSGSRRLASWKDPEGVEIRARSKEQAVQMLSALREQIMSNAASFEELAETNSDCSSARQGGNLGDFGRGEMQRPFEEAVYALEVGGLSDIVETGSGVHIIRRTK